MTIADEIPAEYLWCVDMRHAWNPDSLVSREVFNRRIERWEIHRTVRCMNCPKHKTQRLTKSYQLLGTSYDSPPDYRVGSRLTARDRAQIRARSTTLRGGAEKPDAEERKAARKASNVTPISRRKRA